MIQFITEHKLGIIGMAVGGIAGFAYYKLVGCAGGCPITSHPLNSSAYGALMGVLLFTSFKGAAREKSFNDGGTKTISGDKKMNAGDSL